MAYSDSRDALLEANQRTEDTAAYTSLDAQATKIATQYVQGWYDEATDLSARSTKNPADTVDINALRQRLLDDITAILTPEIQAPATRSR